MIDKTQLKYQYRCLNCRAKIGSVIEMKKCGICNGELGDLFSNLTNEEKLKQRVEKHKEIVLDLNKLYEDKNRKYGNAFSDTIKKYGYISALTRMNDKFSRIETMTLNEIKDDEERLEDSLLDLANYCILYLMELSDTD